MADESANTLTVAYLSPAARIVFKALSIVIDDRQPDISVATELKFYVAAALAERERRDGPIELPPEALSMFDKPVTNTAASPPPLYEPLRLKRHLPGL